MKKISLPDTAFEVLEASKEALAFSELYAKVAEIAELNEDEKRAMIGRFYTDLSLDGRIVGLSNNVWDLRSRHKLEDFNLSAVDLYTTEEEEEIDEEDRKEEQEYDASVEGRGIEEPEFGEDGESDSKSRESKEAAELVGLGGEGNDY